VTGTDDVDRDDTLAWARSEITAFDAYARARGVSLSATSCAAIAEFLRSLLALAEVDRVRAAAMRLLDNVDPYGSALEVEHGADGEELYGDLAEALGLPRRPPSHPAAPPRNVAAHGRRVGEIPGDQPVSEHHCPTCGQKMTAYSAQLSDTPPDWDRPARTPGYYAEPCGHPVLVVEGAAGLRFVEPPADLLKLDYSPRATQEEDSP
jgi:hypothetical protein